jgi:hypothetical protein
MSEHETDDCEAMYYQARFIADRYPVDQYLYGNQGPWPQPCPDHPLGQAPEVLHIPKPEQSAWNWKVGLNYLITFLTYSPRALWDAWRNPNLDEIDDEEFVEILCEGFYSKFLYPLDEDDRAFFAEYIDPDAGPYYKADFRAMREIRETYPGTYAAQTVTLFRRKDAELFGRHGYEVIAIRVISGAGVGGQDVVWRPADTDAWRLAKYFAIQGANHCMNLIEHARVHFPSDPINAVTKTWLPKSNIIFRLLIPHLYLSLPVNNSVLEGQRSLIARTGWTIWSPFVALGGEVRKLLPYAWSGMPRNNAYPCYRFPLVPRELPSLYGRFLQAYYDTIYRFVRDVIDLHYTQAYAMEGSPDIYYTRQWAEYVRDWVPGFPSGDEILPDDPAEGFETLARAVAMIIWDVSLAHCADHMSLWRLSPNKNVFRVRRPPPRPDDTSNGSLRGLTTWFDLFQSRLTYKLFYEPHNQSLLKDTEYDLPGEAEHHWNRRIHEDLVATEAAMRALLAEHGRELFIDLDHTAASIQF